MSSSSPQANPRSSGKLSTSPFTSPRTSTPPVRALARSSSQELVKKEVEKFEALSRTQATTPISRTTSRISLINSQSSPNLAAFRLSVTNMPKQTSPRSPTSIPKNQQPHESTQPALEILNPHTTKTPRSPRAEAQNSYHTQSADNPSSSSPSPPMNYHARNNQNQNQGATTSAQPINTSADSWLQQDSLSSSLSISASLDALDYVDQIGMSPSSSTSPTLSSKTLPNDSFVHFQALDGNPTVDKMERVAALRDAIRQALAHIYTLLNKVEQQEVKGAAAPNPAVAKKLRELVKFLRHLVENTPENERVTMLIAQTQQSVLNTKTSSNDAERLELFKSVMAMALLEIRCKLGSLQKRADETISLSTAMYDAQTIRSVRQYLDGKGNLEIDPKKHKLVVKPVRASNQKWNRFSSSLELARVPSFDGQKFGQLVKAVGYTSTEMLRRLDSFARMCEAKDPKIRNEATKRAAEMLDVFKDDFEEIGRQDADPKPAGADAIRYIKDQIEMHMKIVEGMKTPETDPESIATVIRFAKKIRELKKYTLRAGAVMAVRDPTVEKAEGVKLPRLIVLLATERAEVEKADEAFEEDVQEDISALNTRRHLLTLSIRNLDRKINFLIKSRKHKEEETEMEEEEVYQFFDQTTCEENPLGDRKEHYEQFISLLRKHPRYLAALVRDLPFADMEPLVQTITFSLFSDLYLAREEYLVLMLIESIMEAEFVNCKEVDTYLRANTFITKLLAGYTKRQSGRLYLTQTLRDSVKAIVQDPGLDLEMDTTKLYKSLVSQEILPTDSNEDEEESASIDKTTANFNSTADHPDVKKVYNEHRFKLMYFCKLFLDNIVTNLPAMPFGLRWITRQLISKARQKFPDVTDAKLDLLMGGFIFLRYLCPAIVAPESHGIVAHISSTVRRNLVLIAKVLQNLANNCMFTKKEPFMGSMNTFLIDNSALLHDYFANLVNVGDAATYYRMSSLKRPPPNQIERTVTISPNELYDIHRKISKAAKIAAANGGSAFPLSPPASPRNGSPLSDPLEALLAKMGPVPENLQRRKNKFVLLNVYAIPEQGAVVKEPSPEETLLESVKGDVVNVLAGVTTPVKDGASLSDVLDALMLGVPNPETMEAAKRSLGTLPQQLQDQNYAALLAQMEKDYQQRQMSREAALTSKVEQQDALDHQKKEVARLLEEKKIYSQYLQNVMLDAYLKKIKNKPMIGPYKFTIRELEKRAVIVPTENLAALRATVIIKMSCTNPGSVNITTKYKKFSRFFELQLLDLMDDLVLHDTISYDEITFDIRKLISFINKYILG